MIIRSIKACLALFSLMLCSSLVNAQVYKNVTEGADGMRIRVKNGQSDLRGSVYLFDDWKKGKVSFGDGSEPQTKDIKYDVMSNVLVVRGENDVENVFTSPVNKFSIYNDNVWEEFTSGFNGKELKSTEFVQIIYSSAKVNFFKKETKSIIESRGYNTSVVEKKVETADTYYLQLDPKSTELVLCKRDKKAILNVLNKPQLEAFLKAEKLNVKKDEDLKKLFNYYNTI